MLHSKESYCAVLSCGAVYHTVQGAEGGSYLGADHLTLEEGGG